MPNATHRHAIGRSRFVSASRNALSDGGFESTSSDAIDKLVMRERSLTAERRLQIARDEERDDAHHEHERHRSHERGRPTAIDDVRVHAVTRDGDEEEHREVRAGLAELSRASEAPPPRRREEDVRG